MSVQHLFRLFSLLSGSLESSVEYHMSDKVLTIPKTADTGTKTAGPEQPPSNVQINSAEWQAANAKHQEGKGQTSCCDCKITGKLDEKDTAKTVEKLSKATSTDARLAALGKLADGGVEKFSIKDKDGTTRQFRIETEKVGKSTLLHCYGIDDQKQEQVVMRAARSADGTFKQQRNKEDQLVSFNGDAWNKSMSGKSYLVGEPSEQLAKKTTEGSERKSDRKVEKNTSHERSKGSTSNDDRSLGKRNTSHDVGSNGKIRRHESHSRDRDRDDDHDRRDRREDKHARRSDRRDDRGSRFNLGEAFGTVVRFAAPFLLSALDGGRNSNDCNPYRHQNNGFRSDRGYREYYDSDRSGYDSYYRGQDYRGRQDHCRNDYDRRYGNDRSYYDPYGQNRRNDYDRHDRQGRNDHHKQNRRSSNWLSKLFN